MSGNPPPCSLCEYLVTGPQFFAAWEVEGARREEEIRRLSDAGQPGHVLAQKKFQLKRFMANYAQVKARCEE